MLEFFRRHSRFVLVVLFLLVVPSFVFFGVADYQGMLSNEVKLVSVNGEKITQNDFRSYWTRHLDQLRRQQGAQFDIAQEDTLPKRLAGLERLVQDSVIQYALDKGHFVVSDAMVIDWIRQQAQFQRNGRFERELYTQFLQQNGYSAPQYEAFVRNQVARLFLLAPPSFAQGASSEKQQRSLVDTLSQERQVRLRIFDQADYLPSVTPSEATLAQWYASEGVQAFTVPEYVNIDYILLNEASVMAQVGDPSEADLYAYYQSNIARYTPVQRRHVKHIQLSDQALAQSLYTQLLQDPTQFEAFVQAHSIDEGTKLQGGDLGFLQIGDIPGLEDTVFALEAPGLTAVVPLQGAYHLFKVEQIEGGEPPSFESLKTTLRDEVRLQLASERFADLATQLTHVTHEHGDSLQPVANQLGLSVSHAEGLGRTQWYSAAQRALASAPQTPQFLNHPRVFEVAYSPEVYQQGLNSGAIELSPSEFLVLRIREKVPAHQPPLAQVRSQVLQAYQESQAITAARQAGEQALATLPLKPDDTGFRERFGVNRLLAQVPSDLQQSILRAPAEPLPTWVGANIPNGYAIAMVETPATHNAELQEVAKQYIASVMQTSEQYALLEAFVKGLQSQQQVKYADNLHDLLRD